MLPTLATIALLHWVVLITPGVNFVLIGQLAASGKRSAAVMAVLGITCMTLTWAVLSILGLGLLFSTHPALRLAMQLAGAVYLLHVAFRTWRSGTTAVEPQQALAMRHWQAFRLGFITNALNAKTALFFGSVFATALPAQPSPWLMACAVAVVYANALVWHLVLALAFSNPRVQAGYHRQRNRLNRAAGLVIGAFGAKLLLATLQEYRDRFSGA